jgi:carboxyl-terminal processing protease
MKNIKQKIKKNTNKIIKNIDKKIKLDKNRFNSAELILIIIMSLLLGLIVGEIIFSNKCTDSKIVNNENEMQKVYNTLLKDYYGKIDEDKLSEAAIQGMMQYLEDQYSVYYNEEESEDFNLRLNGTFTGIGLEVTQDSDNNVIVASVFDNSPAKKAGIKAKDIITKVNNETTEGKKLKEVTEKIKSLKGKFTITIKRGTEEKTVTLSTDTISIPSVTSRIINENNKKIGYIYISIFALNTDEQFKTELQKLEKQNIDSLIIDVRSNTGGHLKSVKQIASNFLNKDQVICQIKSKDKTEKIYSTENNNRKYKIAVLINDGSASGSEVLAAALNEEYGAELIGVTTYGKGTVQKVMTLSNGSMVKYTAETWLTSKGNSIDKTGIKPTIEVKIDDKYLETGKNEDDNQLQKAIETLSK